MRSVPRCYKQDKIVRSQSFSEEYVSELVRELQFSRCELLL
jgi:hypothetical protein